MSFTLYDILGVRSSASNEEIKIAYKKLAKQYHPDKNAGSAWHEEQFKRINQAYQILSNTGKRKHYDNIKEYESFQSRNTKPTSPRNSEPVRNTTYTKRPTSAKKKYEVTISEKKINLISVGYYVVLLGFLGILFEYQDGRKIENNFAQAKRYESLDQYANAISIYSEIILVDKKNAEAYERLAMSRMHVTTDLKWVVEDLTNAINYSEKPSDTLLFKRATCYFKLKEYLLAITDLNAITKNHHTLLDSAYFYRGASNFELTNYNLSYLDLSHYIKLNSTSIESIKMRGYSYWQNNNFKNALSDYNYLIAVQQEIGEHYYNRGFINLALKDSINGCEDLTNSFLLGYSDALDATRNHCSKKIY